MVGVGTPAMPPSSTTEPTSASSSSARPASTSCSIEVLCAPTASAPAMRCSSVILKRTPSASATACPSAIIAAASARVPGKRQMSSSVACVSALIGLKLRLPQSLIQISLRMSLLTGALKPAFISACDSASMRSLRVPSGSPKVKRLPSITRTTPGATSSAAG